MKKSLFAAVLALAVLAGSAIAQAPKTTDILGTWAGTAVVSDDGTQLEIVVVIGKTDAGYTGNLSDKTGMVPETPLREIVFKNNKLTFEFDLVQGAGASLIKIELAYEADTLKGAWSDEEGNSGAISLVLQK